MEDSNAQQYIQEVLTKADVTLNGNRPYDIQIRDERALKRILRDGSLGLGETYMEGWWDCQRLDELSYQLCSAAIDKAVKTKPLHLLYKLASKLFNQQSRKLAKDVAKVHYDLNNTLFELMLGKTMAYSCAYWKQAQDLDSAQLAKYDLVCRKLQLSSQDCLLDIGCGWGGLAAYATENYGCQAVGISIAANQISYAKEHYRHLPVEFYLADYRDVATYNPQQIKFTKLASIGAFEHVGPKNYPYFLQLMKEQLSPQGLFLLHTIGSNETVNATDPWISKYIFPHGNLPSMLQLSKALENKFIIEDWHNFGSFYDPTLVAWNQNFEMNWAKISANFDQRFYRMWRFYLLMCAGMFRSRTAQLWQLVLSPSGVQGGYISIR